MTDSYLHVRHLTAATSQAMTCACKWTGWHRWSTTKGVFFLIPFRALQTWFISNGGSWHIQMQIIKRKKTRLIRIDALHFSQDRTLTTWLCREQDFGGEGSSCCWCDPCSRLFPPGKTAGGLGGRLLVKMPPHTRIVMCHGCYSFIGTCVAWLPLLFMCICDLHFQFNLSPFHTRWFLYSFKLSYNSCPVINRD